MRSSPSSQNHLQDRAALIAREFQDFAYIVSHDLNAPLRHVKEFTNLIIESKNDNLTAEEQEYVSFLKKSLKKLDDMQSALLVYSRIDTQPGPLQKTDFAAAAQSVLQGLITAAERDLSILECDNLPILDSRTDQIHLLFFHLIDNGLKFNKQPEKKKKIHISGKELPDSWRIEIRDNGIGIDKKYHEEVFRLFRCLDAGKYPGIGAGLPIARKIVNRHGGEISIESTPPGGTAIIFSIAKNL